MDLVQIWQNALGELQVSLSRANFETWFKNTFIYEYKKNIFTIGVPSFFIEDWLKKKYLKEIQKAYPQACGQFIKNILTHQDSIIAEELHSK